MIAKCIKDIIEPIGFVNEGDNEEERWVANFLCDLTGNILTFALVESADDFGVRKIMFNICDDDGNLVNTATFDQMLMSVERDMQKVPKKSNKIYECVYNLRVQVPVDMTDVLHRKYNDIIRDGYITEPEIAEQVARAELRCCFSNVHINLINFECDNIITHDK